jgi:hypothetical protein
VFTRLISAIFACLIAFQAQAATTAVTQSGAWTFTQASVAKSVSPISLFISTATTYAINDAVGGLQTVAAFDSTTKSGILGGLRFGLKGASQTPTLTAYVFNKNPTGTTCTNDAAFSLASADEPYIVGIYTVTMAVTQGTTKTNGEVEIARPMANADTSPTANLYVCIVTGTSLTTAANDLTMTLFVKRD